MKIKFSRITWLFRVVIFSLGIVLLSSVENTSVAGDKKPLQHKKKTTQTSKPSSNSVAPKPVFDDKVIIPKKPIKPNKPGTVYQKPHKKNTMKQSTQPSKKRVMPKPRKKKGK